MKTALTHPPDPARRRSRCRAFIHLAAIVAVSLVAARPATAAVVTNWVAYNDFGPDGGAAPFVKAPNVTGYNMGFGPGGLLTNSPGGLFPASELPAGYPLDGQAKLIVTPIAATGVFALPAAGSQPNAGTPAYNMFADWVSIGNSGSMFGVGAGHQVLLTFSNLNPTMKYKFRGTTVRGGTGVGTHDLRWTLNSITGAVSFVSAHTVSTTMLVPESPVPGLALTNGQVAWNSGINKRGEVVGWDEIVPAPNGTFTIVNQPYNGNFVGDSTVTMGDGSTPTGVANGATAAATANVGYVLEAIVLLEYGEPQDLAWTTQPVASVTTTQMLNFSITARASGTAPNYQWYKEGVGLIPGANLPTFTKTSAAVADSGNYYCVVSNQKGTLTSSSCAVTVVPDNVKPTVVNITANATFDAIVVQYSERVNLTEATDQFPYAIGAAGSGPASVTILNPGSVTSGTIVQLNLAPADLLAPDTEYALVVSDVHDLAGNNIDGTHTYSFHSWVVGPAGVVKFETFNVNGRGTIDDLITSQPNFPNNPRETMLITGFDSRLAYADDAHEDYAGRMYGLFIPPASGNWVFHMRSDDPGRLFINPNGPSAAGKIQVGDQAGCCNVFPAAGSQLSQPFALEAGHGYYVELVWREYGGGDYGQVAVALVGAPAPTTPNLIGSYVGSPAAPAGVGGTITFTQQPAGITVDENASVTFTATATSTYGLPMAYQWRKDNADIPGATGPSYTFTATTADDGAKYSLVASIVGASATSSQATLVVREDVVLPTVTSAKADNTFTTVLIRFSELVQTADATDEFNYSVKIGGVDGPQVINATLQADGRSVILELDAPLSAGASFTITVKNVHDIAGNTMVDATLPFNSWSVVPGFVTFQTYNTPVSGTAIDLLKSSPDYPYNPRETFYIRSFNTREAYPDDVHEQYGGRIYGVFYPPTTGNWTFYLRSDDAGELYVNPTGVDSGGKVLATAETGCCNGFSAHASLPYALTQGVPVYIEALYKEGGGGDYCQVAAKLDTDPTNPDDLSPISYKQLGTVIDPTGISVAINSQPSDQVGVLSTPPAVAFSETFTAGDGGFTVVTVGAPSNPWSYNSGNGSWSCYHINACGAAGNGSSLISPTITVSKAGHLVVQIKHRYSFEGGSWDGGQLRMSVNGGAFTTVSASAFSAGGYEATALIGNHPLNGQAAWNGDSPGYSGPAFITSQADLGQFSPGTAVQVQLVAAWDECTTGSNPSWQVDSIVVNEGLVKLYTSDFSSSGSGFTVANSTPAPAGPWIYDAVKGTWSTAGGEGSVYSLLNGQTLHVANSGTVRLTFNHRYNFEYDGTRWDGGQVRMSVNGGAYTTVPAQSFTSNGYTGIIAGNVLIKNQPGFNAKSAGYTNNTFITSMASLGAFSAGDTISIQFIGAWDEGFAETAPNWEIKQVTLEDGVALPVNFTVTATAVVPGATGMPIAYQWQRDAGSGFEDIPGATASTLSFTPQASDDGTHYRVIVSTVGASVTSTSALLTVIVAPPALTITVASPSSVVLSWPTSATGYTLQQASTLLSPGTVWTPVGLPVVVQGGANTVTVTGANVGNKFFRLVK
jgi:hypothetical protein